VAIGARPGSAQLAGAANMAKAYGSSVMAWERKLASLNQWHLSSVASYHQPISMKIINENINGLA
jgi:hypothetical protein